MEATALRNDTADETEIAGSGFEGTDDDPEEDDPAQTDMPGGL